MVHPSILETSSPNRFPDEFLLPLPLAVGKHVTMVDVLHRVGTVLSFSPVFGIGTPPTPHPQASVPPPPRFCGEGHTRWRERGWESPIRRGDIHCGTLYIYVLCGVLPAQATKGDKPYYQNIQKRKKLLKRNEGVSPCIFRHMCTVFFPRVVRPCRMYGNNSYILNRRQRFSISARKQTEMQSRCYCYNFYVPCLNPV